jgi:hypothetical protein
MYIKYTFVSDNNLAGLLAFKVLGAVALSVTIPLVVEGLDSGLHVGRLGRTGNMLVIPLRLLALWTLCQLTGLLKVRSLVDQQHKNKIDEAYPRQCPYLRAFDSWRERGRLADSMASDKNRSMQEFT